MPKKKSRVGNALVVGAFSAAVIAGASQEWVRDSVGWAGEGTGHYVLRPLGHLGMSVFEWAFHSDGDQKSGDFAYPIDGVQCPKDKEPALVGVGQSEATTFRNYNHALSPAQQDDMIHKFHLNADAVVVEQWVAIYKACLPEDKN